jgi:hypothetical protein
MQLHRTGFLACVVTIILAASLCESLLMPYTPVISSITPNAGSYAGGTEIRINGAGLLSTNVQGTFVHLVLIVL